MILKGRNSTRTPFIQITKINSFGYICIIIHSFSLLLLPPPSSPLSTVLFPNFLRLDYRLDPLVLRGLFLKSKNILSCNHHIVIKFRTFNIDKHFNYSLHSNFVNCFNRSLYSTFFLLVQDHTSHLVVLSQAFDPLILLSMGFFFFFFFWKCHTACSILVPCPEIEPGPSAMKALNPND